MKKHLITPLVIGVGLALAASGASAADHMASASGANVIPDQPIAFTLDDQYDPCEDFASYVNAKWNKANPIPADETRWGAFGILHKKSLQQQKLILVNAARDAQDHKGSPLERKLGNLYAAGLDTAAINKLGYTPIKSKLAQIDNLKNTADIVNFIDTSYNEGDGYVFSFGSGADFNDATRQIGYVYESGLGLPTRAYYLEKKYKPIRDAYVKYVAKSLELIGASASQAKKQAQSVLAFETEMAKASLSPTQMRNLDNQYHFVTVAEADKVSPHFSWEKFFKAQGVNIGKGFSLSQPKFIAEFDKLLVKAPVSQWQAYLKFHLVSSASPALSKAFQDNHFSFYGKTLRGQPQQKDRWKRVLRAVNGAMGMGLGQLYVAKYFPPETKARAEKLVTNVRNALKEHIEHLDWMSAATKKKALRKWSLFLPKIGYPDKGEWRDWSGLTIQPGHWFDNLEAASKYNYHYDISKIGKKTDRKEWYMTPQTINAYYDPSTNTINFPAAILQPPFFYAHGDDAVNYGGIGFVIGHESSHGFDDQGSQFDGHGNRVNWWTKQDKKRFDERTGALARQYNQYTPIPGKPDLHVKGKLTLGEDIGDLGGLNIAYTALQTALDKHPAEARKKIDGLTQNQRFFLSSARVWEGTARVKTAELLLNVDPHAPAKIRAFASSSNMPEFAEAFTCKVGSTMDRKHPVKIW
ncbi:MAG TPA: M13 family metallopeptidase [Gammaproteobacteria bacterium]|nr:M13 family metallopeptidase [Gammaproteobacteria bacterium]